MKIFQGFLQLIKTKYHVYRILYRVTREARGIDLYEESIYFWTIHGFVVSYAYAAVAYGVFFLIQFVINMGKVDTGQKRSREN